MRVIYKPWIMAHILKLIDTAYSEAKKIDKIILTEAEYEQVRNEVQVPHSPKRPTGPFTIYGVNVEVE